MGSVAFELLLPPARWDMIAGGVPPEDVMVAAKVVTLAKVWLGGRAQASSEWHKDLCVQWVGRKPPFPPWPQ